MIERRLLVRAVPYLVIGAAAGYLFYVAAHIEFQSRPATLGPDFWPRLILGLIIVTCVYAAVKTLLAQRPSDDRDRVLRDIVPDKAMALDAVLEARPEAHHPVRLAGGIALTAAYVVLVQKLGFFLATVPYLAAFIVLGGYRRWGVIAASSLLGTLLMLFLFMKVVYVSLPLGEGPFQQVTLWLMQLLRIR